ncbi:putative serine/arginine repetitive matrix protein 1 isoform X1 [Iris pallida]|uniref:Serine/arginine repetitive matrix protein 1 isoform X1 n=1 Tax=Iris pallida TaxID=29817 RepID=A0AAX6F0Y4_IRIPA|nr:putative serine/arginine repetitive matrix protein 1 isoform X1 [Iris pallida]
MEGRLRKYGGQASPEMPRKHHHHHHQQQQQQQPRKIPVVYYLCRNRHLEHPHFIEVPLSSPEGLHLRDVTKRLIELRGKGMPSMYSWSCKRSYKNGFVWHDLSEDDLILPAHGNEYVLKGSELLDQSPPDRVHNGNAGSTSLKLVNQKSPQTTETTQEASSSSSPVTVIKESKTTPLPLSPPPSNNQEDGQSPRRQPSWDSGSPGPSEFRVYKPAGAADASTQTDDAGRRKAREKGQGTCTRGVSTEDGPEGYEFEEGRRRNQAPVVEEISPVQTSSSASSSGGKMETLESLIRADARKMNSFRILEGEEVYLPTGSRLRATNVLMQLITCGSLSVKDHNRFGIVPTYKTTYSHVKYPSPMFAGSMVLGELDCLSENPRLTGLRMEEKEYFSGSLIETKKHKEETGEGVPTLKRSSSYNADRSCKSPDSKHEKEKVIDSSRSKCLPRTMKISSSNKQHRHRMMRSPVSDCPRNSSAGPDSSHSSQGGSKRFTDASSVKGSSTRLESFKEEKEKVIKIEESLLQELGL